MQQVISTSHKSYWLMLKIVKSLEEIAHLIIEATGGTKMGEVSGVLCGAEY